MVLQFCLQVVRELMGGLCNDILNLIKHTVCTLPYDNETNTFISKSIVGDTVMYKHKF